ncbi:chemotaxis protein CheW [Paraliobacillus ryukyuensis]|uniref:Purine-binding chemotaxis protein CheW n=1 Tax=Paraliobacillus ryukyuensis TaxID=200904 RepID=A0A366EHF3_9BACI|nr:chemotaxis protein CheW [Paraliobacillus ryukyuensis]RBP01778.1 purine-binding chemotaxis protein CheW [Paraliobacillus ryukyuensis]
MSSEETLEEQTVYIKSIVFDLKGEEYALPVEYVGSIERMMHITRVPQTASFVKGVLNLRGVVTPIVDLRDRFGFDAVTETDSTRIIILEVNGLEVGLIVDAAYDVIDIPKEAIEPPPEVIGSVQVDYIHGVAKLDERLLILLDMEKVLNAKGMSDLYQKQS